MNRGRLVRTLYALGPTSIAGLAAALSWSERRTERLVRDLARTEEAGVVYNPGARRVRIGRPDPQELRPKPPSAALSIEVADAREPLSPPESSGRAPTSPAPTPPPLPARGFGKGLKCPSCSGPMEPTTTGGALVCRDCGRLSLNRSAGPPAPTVPAPSPPEFVVGSHGPISDRRAQEMFAAYVTSRPIPCPKCRSPLRHRGLGDYGCPACGERIRFKNPHDPKPAPSGLAPSVTELSPSAR